ncbi:MAG TPA: hypothetical protein VNT57_02500 [Desulfobacteria bacterium]|nr:hypothetical protein [Desulfobacteria bacterium]
MPKKKKSDLAIPGHAEWEAMFTGMGVRKNGKKYYKPTEDGWSKMFGDIDLVSAKADKNKVKAKGGTKTYSARLSSPMSGVMQTVTTEIKPGQRYEVSYNASTNSSSGFLATTVTFLSNNDAPLGMPSSGGVKLSTLESGYTPVSFATGPAPEEAAKAQLAFIVFGQEPDKSANIDKVSFKVVN